MENEEEINKRIYTFPTSAIEQHGKKLSYFEFISSFQNKECNAALQRICSRINMGNIENMIDETPFIDAIQKEFYKIMLRERKEKILDYSLEKLLKSE